MSIINENERQELLFSMAELLEEYDYQFDYDALRIIIDEWAKNKATLIEAFKKHPNYVEGRFMIAFTSNYERVLNVDEISAFVDWLQSRNGPMSTGIENLPEEINRRRLDDCCCWLPDNVFNLFWALPRRACQIIDEEKAQIINDALPNIKARAGQKMSRVINKICVYLGYDKHPEYNREFAKFADALNPLIIKRHTVISLNPLDYLTMSFGNSWASCHTIDKTNKRGMPNNYSGCYSSGTISYMLDSSSIIMYTVEADYDGTDYWKQSKIHRQMFHWGEEKLVQGRLYPQSNDSGADEYTTYRNIVQEIISKCFEFDNLWTVSKGVSAASRYIISQGTHYADYSNFSNCTLSRIKDNMNESSFIVGAEPICIECGCRHSVAENINCCAEDGYYTCEDCGCRLSEDDVIWVDDYAYCRDCVSYCDDCDSYHREESTWLGDYDRNVCPRCLDQYYVVCGCCAEYIDRDYAVYDDETDEYYCPEHVPEREEEEEEE